MKLLFLFCLFILGCRDKKYEPSTEVLAQVEQNMNEQGVTGKYLGNGTYEITDIQKKQVLNRFTEQKVQMEMENELNQKSISVHNYLIIENINAYLNDTTLVNFSGLKRYEEKWRKDMLRKGNRKAYRVGAVTDYPNWINSPFRNPKNKFYEPPRN